MELMMTGCGYGTLYPISFFIALRPIDRNDTAQATGIFYQALLYLTTFSARYILASR